MAFVVHSSLLYAAAVEREYQSGTTGDLMRKQQKGFSLIELLIVVAIILIIAAIAIPNLLRSKMAANEASAVGSLRTLVTATVTYSSTYGNGFPPTLGSMSGAAGAINATCDQSLLVDPLLGANGAGNTSQKSGYNFTYVPLSPIPTTVAGCTSPGMNNYSINAVPVTVGSTGQRGFFVDPSGVIRFTTDGTIPTVASPALQ
jgi:type IV pilus assembly protein PilA